MSYRYSLLPAVGVICLLLSGSLPATESQRRSSLLSLVTDDIGDRALACTGCHGKEGVATASGFFPRIAGKPAGYLFNQLRSFRHGHRSFAAMNSLVANLPDAYLREFAQYFSALELPYPPPVLQAQSDTDILRATELIRQGDARLDVPSCSSCHGEKLTGFAPAVPGLLGLPRDYLNAQLGAWRNGARSADGPDCMHTIVNRLAVADLARVTNWLANQPVPDNGKPGTAFPTGDKPMACGSFEAPGPVAAPSAPASRGEYLARIGNCAGCHTRSGGRPYAGGVAIETPFGRVYGSNLTPDADTGIGRWSADDFWRAMTRGERPDGHLLNPVFPYQFFSGLRRNDSDAIHAWLRGLAPVRQPNQAHALRFPYGTQPALWAWRWMYFDPASASADRPLPPGSKEFNAGASGAAADQLVQGRYLFETLAHCQACHGKRDTFGGFTQADRSGGAKLPGDEGGYAPALTNAADGGLAAWSHEQIIRFLATGHNDAADAQGLMAEVVQHSTQFFTPEDASALAHWLQAIDKPVDRTDRPAPAARIRPSAQKHYVALCADCHGEDGLGKPGRYPPLAGRRSVLIDDADNVIRMVLYGGFGAATLSTPRPWGMPGFVHSLSDEEAAHLIDYVRSSWGNSARAVSPVDVQRAR